MKFKTKMKIFFKDVHHKTKMRFMTTEQLKQETMYLIRDNYNIRRKRVSNVKFWGNDQIKYLFMDELYGVICYTPEPTRIDKEPFLVRSECLFKLYNDIMLIRGDILDDNIKIDLEYVKTKNIQYGGSGDEII